MKELAYGLVLLFISSCAAMGITPKPALDSWEGQEMVICCEKSADQIGDCSQEDWVRVIQTHCDGTAKALKGGKSQKVTGGRITESSNPYDPSESRSLDIDQKITKVQCVTYSCSGKVRP